MLASRDRVIRIYTGVYRWHDKSAREIMSVTATLPSRHLASDPLGRSVQSRRALRLLLAGLGLSYPWDKRSLKLVESCEIHPPDSFSLGNNTNIETATNLLAAFPYVEIILS